MSLSDYRRQTAKHNKPKQIFLILVIIAGLVSIGYTINNSGGFDLAASGVRKIMPKQIAEGKTIFSMEPSLQYQYGIYRDLAVVSDRDTVRGIAKNGEEKWKFNLNFSAPILDTNDKYFLVADKGAKIVRLFDSSGQKAQIDTEESILNANLSSDCITIVTKQKGYKGAVLVYNTNGELLFRWLSGSASIVYTALSPDGTRLAASVADTAAGKLSGGVMMFDIKTDTKPYASLTYPDCLISAVNWNDNGLLVMSGDRFLAAADRRGKELWKYDFGGRTLAAFDIKSPKHYVLAFGNTLSDSGRDWTVEFVDGGGKKTGSYKAVGEVKSICAVGGDAVIAGQREIAVVGRTGIEKSRTPLKYDLRYVMPYPSGGDALVISGVKAEVVGIY